MPLVPQDVRGVSTRAMSEAQRVREEGAAAQTSDAEAKPVQVDLLLQLQQMMAEQARRQEEQARRQEEQARRQEEQARCQAEQLRELKEEQARRQEEQARRQEEQARRQEEQARRQEEQARCQAEQLRELKEDQARRQEDQARRQEEQARRLEEMHKDFTKGLQKAVERVQEVEEGLGKLEHRVMAIEERVKEEISKIKQEVTSPSPLKSRSRLAAVFDAPNVASSATKGLKIPHYDGTTSWNAFKLQFETLMEAYGWTQKEAQSALTLALRDQALSVLEAIGASGDLSLSALLDALEARFGDSHLEHVYRAQLKERTQRANESLQQWSVEIEKLVRRAFRSTPSMIEGTLLQAFIDGIRDPEVRAAVHLGHHKNMKEALAHALEVEAVRGNSRTLCLREMTTTEQVPPRRRNFMCYGCGERGHMRSNCPKKVNRQDAAESDVVCGSDGQTYPSQCELDSTACREQSDLQLAYKGDCALCEGVQCAFGAHCAAGECVCPTDCTGAAREPVCGSTMQTFPNECELQKAACRLPPPAKLHVIFYGDCKDRLAVVPPIAMSTYQ
ncbi:unnamed protein product [Spodoptera exigua]|nr:unnamed protein product [Spodoptera exigua]